MSTIKLKCRPLNVYNYARYALHSVYFETENKILFKNWRGEDDGRARPCIGDWHWFLVTPIQGVTKYEQWRFWVYSIIIPEEKSRSGEYSWAKTHFYNSVLVSEFPRDQVKEEAKKNWIK